MHISLLLPAAASTGSVAKPPPANVKPWLSSVGKNTNASEFEKSNPTAPREKLVPAPGGEPAIVLDELEVMSGHVLDGAATASTCRLRQLHVED